MLKVKALATFALGFVLVACGNEDPQDPVTESLTIYKSPTCGCCTKWQDHLTESGIHNVGQNTKLLSQLKTELGIQTQYRSCHTGVSKDGYVFEGHVPAKFIQQFLQQPPADAIGLAVPAMPIGSPGMEVDNGHGGSKFMTYQVLLLKSDGSSEVFATLSDYSQQFSQQYSQQHSHQF